MKNKMYIYNMKSYEQEVYIANTLKCIHLISKKEQDIEIDAISNYLKSNKWKKDYGHTHYKLIKKIFWLAGKVPR